jgi:2-furoyl-CoA dehydrogenase FAD binding subunit
VKPAPFAYVRPATLQDAIGELAGAAGTGKVLAGGQSLLPVLAMRLSRPGTVVDINAVAGLGGMERLPKTVRIGATVTQRQVERDRVAADVPLLGLALPFVGHRELRSRGTVCGSLAHADPAAELPAVAACLGATVEIAGPAGRRTASAAEFFAGAMTTTLGSEEIVVAVNFPVAAPGDGFGFAEIARRHGDFALAGVVTRVRSAQGQVLEARITGFGVSDRPITTDVTGLVVSVADRTDVAAALREGTDDLARDVVDTVGDGHGSRAYRRRLFGVLAARELARALGRSRGSQA